MTLLLLALTLLTTPVDPDWLFCLFFREEIQYSFAALETSDDERGDPDERARITVYGKTQVRWQELLCGKEDKRQ